MSGRSHAHYETYRADDGWRWRLRAANGRIVASGEGFASRWHVRRAIWAHMDAAWEANARMDIREASS